MFRKEIKCLFSMVYKHKTIEWEWFKTYQQPISSSKKVNIFLNLLQHLFLTVR